MITLATFGIQCGRHDIVSSQASFCECGPRSVTTTANYGMKYRRLKCVIESRRIAGYYCNSSYVKELAFVGHFLLHVNSEKLLAIDQQNMRILVARSFRQVRTKKGNASELSNAIKKRLALPSNPVSSRGMTFNGRNVPRTVEGSCTFR